ncbi:MAG: ATP-dependent zinc metalloprotease FtsH [Chloroflexi bacterium]|nr:ATP-dependent zinc metalloprotease FtsH [Chloroflexota bacterium]MCH8161101.1 ATP-dependent zinc metalloprotease FtsH [Chloroflexota bacterium]
MDEEADKKPNRRIPWWAFAVIGVIAVLTLSQFVRGGSGGGAEEVSLRTFALEVQAGQAERLIVEGDQLTLERADGSKIESRKEESTSALETLQQLGVTQEALQKIEIEIEKEGSGFGATLAVVLGIAPILFFVVIGFVIFRQMRNSGGGLLNIGKSKARLTGVNGVKPSVVFDDVAGIEEAKLELQEVVEFLKTPEKFARLGAHVPKGVLLVGPPGTGKTLLARAAAGESGVPFFSISGSEFVELFVGAGASRVRDLFEKAKAASPAIIFIDEIDAVGRRRGVGLGGGNDEREQTLNQILVEMDGFENETNVIVVAATNRADVLDPALLRPGRFDRTVMVDPPDVAGREAILRVHARGKVLSPDADLSAIAKLTAGLAGADLENLLNEAGILAARTGASAIGSKELNAAFERIVAGPERTSRVLSAGERRIVAYHEAGHALVMESMPNTDPVHKISIISRGKALGYTISLPETERVLRSKETFEEEIAGLLGGRAAEELNCGGITTGAANDLERATALARAMVTQYGMSDELGLRTFTSNTNGFPDWTQRQEYAEGTALKIDEQISGILERAYERAKATLTERWDAVARLAGGLLEQETLERPEITRLLDGGASADIPCLEESAA